MDYTQSPQNVVDATTGFRRHEDNQALPTVVSEKDINSLIWSLMEVNKAAGVPAAAFDETVQSTYTDVIRAIRRLACANNSYFVAGTYTLSADQLGVILIDATAGPVSLNLPASAAFSFPAEFIFYRLDGSANLVRVSKSAAAGNIDTIDFVPFFDLPGQFASRSVRGNSTALWSTTSSNSLGPIRVARFTSSGTFVVPAGVTTLYMSGCGAGGGGGAGGGAGGTNVGSGGGGGGAGQNFVRQPLTVVPLSTLIITIPSGGAGGLANGSGLAGGSGSTAGATTIVGTGLSFSPAGGGAGLGGLNAPTGSSSGQLGGTGFPGGGMGSDATNGSSSANGGMGGSGPFGGGGAGSRGGAGGGGVAANNGGGFGAGGGGGGGSYLAGNGIGGNGGAGSPGFVTLEW